VQKRKSKFFTYIFVVKGGSLQYGIRASCSEDLPRFGQVIENKNDTESYRNNIYIYIYTYIYIYNRYICYDLVEFM
jgi:hypothetical protein